jgi:hypothetical protein
MSVMMTVTTSQRSSDHGHPQKLPRLSRMGVSAKGLMHRSKVSLFDHLVGAAHQWQRKGHSECFSRLEVDHELHFCLLFDR